MFQKLIQACVHLVQRYLPEPFIFAILLTFLAAMLSMPICHQTPIEIIDNWGGGIWDLLAFSMQMALVLVCGSTLAAAPVIKKGISHLAALPKSPTEAIMLVTGISSIACWINWGFGLIVGVIFAKEVARKVKNVDYRLLIASSYSGFVVWHAGLSGSIPLSMATDGESLRKATNGILDSPVSVSSTIFDIHNLLIVAVIIIALTLINALMHPKGDKVISIDPILLADDDDTVAVQRNTPAEKLENSKVLSWLLALIGLAYLVVHIGFRGGSFDLNSVNMFFLFIGILLHRTPIAYIRSFNKSAAAAAGIILQFPLYAGIMGIITGAGASGICLGSVISNACISISTPQTFPLLTFLSAGLVNLFVPSGGGQWAVQAPIMFPAGANLGVNPNLTGMAIAWGDAWTNLIQPFWALPALAIAKLNAKDIMGFCLIDLFVTGIIICGGLLIWGCF